jgi:DNA-binding beta-propeller fold protein YncE
MKRILEMVAVLAVGMGGSVRGQATSFKLVKVIPVQVAGSGVDYLAFDEGARRMYVTHGTSVVVVDVDQGAVVGKIEGMNRVHGVAITPFHHGFVTSGNSSTVRMFDLKTLATLKDIPAEGTPDGLVYEPMTARVFAFDHKTGVMTVIDAKTGDVAGTAALGGMPEFPATDGKGLVWVNQEDKSTLIKIDAKTMKPVASWPDAPCEGPTGMAMDGKTRMLFVGCGNEKMAAIMADSGKVVATVPIGVHTDATHFDAAKKLIFNANRSNVTVVRMDGPEKFTVVQNYETLGRANTLALDLKKHHVWAAGTLQAADMEKLPAGVDKGMFKVGMFVVMEFAE